MNITSKGPQPLRSKTMMAVKPPAVKSKRFGWWSNPAITVHNTW
jgi:hypothetical protein